MPKSITQYRVFVGSPGGLKDERTGFREKLQRFTAVHSEPRGVTFYPVGWEDTLSGAGRPQAIINEDLKECDYAVFVLYDRWGTPTGSGHSSGTDEEWELAERLYGEGKIRNIALFFKDVDPRQLADPGEQLKKVLAFKAKIEAERKYLFTTYTSADDFCETLEGHLAKWLRDHESPATGAASLTAAAPAIIPTGPVSDGVTPPASPGFDYWIAEANRLLYAEPAENRDYTGAVFCAERALVTASSHFEWAWAKTAIGVAQFHLNNLTVSLTAFTEIADRFELMRDEPRRLLQATALFNKAITLAQLGRHEEEIAVYEDVIARIGTATELPLREQLAKALLNKGITLGQLRRGEEEIAVYEDVIARFGTATELPLCEQVAMALVNKGIALGQLDRRKEEITVYEDVIARFGTATELPLREQVAKALVNKGVVLGQFGRREEEITVYEDVIARFGTTTELLLREQVAMALFNKGIALGQLGRRKEEITVYEDMVARFGTATELPLREQVAKALVNKGVVLGQFGRSDEATTIYDDVIARIDTAIELPLRQQVAMALFNKGIALGELGRRKEEITVYEDMIARFGTATELPLREQVAKALVNKGVVLGQFGRSDEAATILTM